jgi:hypothetical protein
MRSAEHHPLRLQWRMTVANAVREAAAEPAQTIFHGLAWMALCAIALLLADRLLHVLAPDVMRILLAWPVALTMLAALGVGCAARAAVRHLDHRVAMGPWAALPIAALTARGWHGTVALAVSFAGWLLCTLVIWRLTALAPTGASPLAPAWLASVAAVFLAAGVIATLVIPLRPHVAQRTRTPSIGRRQAAASMLVRVAEGPLPHVPQWQQAAAGDAWSAGAGAWPALILLGLAIPAGSPMAGAAAAAFCGVLLIRWSRVVAGALSVLPRLSSLAAAQPLTSDAIGAACWRYPLAATVATAVPVLALLAWRGLSPVLLALAGSAMFGYVALAYAIAWRHRNEPRRRSIAMATSSVAILLVASTLPPLAGVVPVAVIGWHAARARQVP